MLLTLSTLFYIINTLHMGHKRLDVKRLQRY